MSFNKDTVLKKLIKPEDKLFVAKLIDKALKAEDIFSILHSDFLDPYQKSLAENVLGDTGINYVINGGLDGAEREVIFFCPNIMPEKEDLDFNNFFKFIRLDFKGRTHITHRDILGSLMSLGIKREKTGDIVLKEDECFIVVLSEIADYVTLNLSRIKDIKVSADIIDALDIKMPEAKHRTINSTVASMRLDSLVGVGFGMSRSKACEFIRGEKVFVNWQMSKDVSKIVKEGDTITVRGKGRAFIEKINGTTKKGRIGIVIQRS